MNDVWYGESVGFGSGLSTSRHGVLRPSPRPRRHRPRLVAAKTYRSLAVTLKMRAFRSSAPPTCWKLRPWSDERQTPWPAYESELVLASPVPTQREWSAGFTHSAPIEAVTWSWKAGLQCRPPSLEDHTPPSANPAYTHRPSVAIDVERPETRPQPAP